jgi:hypothetical protein
MKEREKKEKEKKLTNIAKIIWLMNLSLTILDDSL